MRKDVDVIEIDEAYYGKKINHYHNIFKPKKTILGAVGRRLGKVMVRVTSDSTRPKLEAFVAKHVNRDSIVITDDYIGYNRLKRIGYRHASVNHSKREYTRGMVHTNSIEGFWGHMKRGIKGIYHWVSTKHLARYVDEYAYRYNTRSMSDMERFDDWLSHAGCNLRYANLIKYGAGYR